MQKRNKKINYEGVIQLRISNSLKQKAFKRAGDKRLSNYIRELIEEDCKEVEE